MSQISSPAENMSPSIINEDKKSIQEEEREKILNVENEQKTNTATTTDEKKPKEVKEGMEVKPKKIPIGGIQMPGFFTRSKSKEHCKDEDLAEGTELIEQDKEKKEETTSIPTRIKLPNPFKKIKTGDPEEGEKSADGKDRLKLLETIRMPLVSVFQRMKRSSESQNLTNNQPGLASLETLEDKSNSDLKTIPLDEKKEPERQEQAGPESTWIQKLQTYRVAIGCGLLFLIVIIVVTVCTTSGGGSDIPRSPPITDGKYIQTTTSCGFVEGKMEDSSFAFRGIPYARQPVGELRFKYAQPLNQVEYCWNGTFKAHNATPTCIQVEPNGTHTGVEDCLTLDVVTPYVRYDNPLPVIVLIGADSFMGGSPGKMRPSARWARSRDVVFVRPNFRLGPLGFLSLDVLSKSDYPHTSGNYALSDILQALTWIQLNIENFGGDKRSVILFGHKAGATLVTALATMPDAKKYFVRAWASSGGAVYPTKPRNDSEAAFRSFLDYAECGDANCLREKDARKLLKSVQFPWIKPQPDLPAKDEDPSKRHQWLVIDGIFLKESPSEIWSRENLPVDLVIGSTAQAGDSALLSLKHTNWTQGFVRQHIKDSFLGAQDLTDVVLKMYPPTYKGLSTLVTDIRIVCPLYNMWKQMKNVTFYVVHRPRGLHQIADVDSDVDVILGRYEPKTPEQKRYFNAMRDLFYHYVWHGKIDPKFSGKNVIVDQDVSLNSSYAECEFWNSKKVVPRFAALD